MIILNSGCTGCYNVVVREKNKTILLSFNHYLSVFVKSFDNLISIYTKKAKVYILIHFLCKVGSVGYVGQPSSSIFCQLLL